MRTQISEFLCKSQKSNSCFDFYNFLEVDWIRMYVSYNFDSLPLPGSFSDRFSYRSGLRCEQHHVERFELHPGSGGAQRDEGLHLDQPDSADGSLQDQALRRTDAPPAAVTGPLRKAKQTCLEDWKSVVASL